MKQQFIIFILVLPLLGGCTLFTGAALGAAGAGATAYYFKDNLKDNI